VAAAVAMKSTPCWSFPRLLMALRLGGARDPADTCG
jgi:hypothetical protein